MSKPRDDDDFVLPPLNFNLDATFDEDEEATPELVKSALREFASQEPLPGIPTNRRALRKPEQYRQMHEPEVLRPEILDALDLGHYDVIPIWMPGASERFLGLFLPAVKKDYDETGIGTWDCIIQFRAVNSFEEDRLRRFKGTISQMLSRLRIEVNRGEDWRFAMLRYEVLPDGRHVACSWARMTLPHFNEWLASRNRERYKERSTLNMLKDYL